MSETRDGRTQRNGRAALGAYTSLAGIESAEDARSLVEQCAALGVDRIMVLAGKQVLEARLAGEEAGAFDSFGAVCSAAQDAGMTTHAWLCLYVEHMDRATRIVREHPEYLVVNRDGKSNLEQPTWSTVDPKYSTYWVCPSAPEYRRFLTGLMLHLVDRYGVDGIHLDYVRYPEEVEARQYCYCERCRRQFRELYGYELPVNDVIAHRYHVSNMTENVTRSVAAFAEAVHGRGKEISAYVFTDYATAIEACYQDWPDFSRYLDFLVLTTYEVREAYAQTLLERGRRVTGGACPITAAVYSLPHVRRSAGGGQRWWKGRDEDVLETLRGCLAGGAQTIWLFTCDALFSPQLDADRSRYLLDGIRSRMS